jgi:hypothetical protein
MQRERDAADEEAEGFKRERDNAWATLKSDGSMRSPRERAGRRADALFGRALALSHDHGLSW